MIEEADQHRDKRQRLEPQRNEDAMEVNASMLPTNHERQKPMKEEGGSSPKVADIALNLETDDVSHEQLQKDMGGAFLLCRSSIALLLILLTWAPVLTYLRCRATTYQTDARDESSWYIWSESTRQHCRAY